jgi:hypothetical protein
MLDVSVAMTADKKMFSGEIKSLLHGWFDKAIEVMWLYQFSGILIVNARSIVALAFG